MRSSSILPLLIVLGTLPASEQEGSFAVPTEVAPLADDFARAIVCIDLKRAGICCAFIEFRNPLMNRTFGAADFY